MSTSFLRASGTAALALAAIAVTPGDSMGTDSKVAGPTACQLGASVAGARLAYASSGVTNVSGINVGVVCALERDNVINTNGLSDLEVVVTAPAGGGNFDCTALSEDRNGNPLIAVHRTTTTPGTHILNWNASITVSANRGYYIVSCDVPANGIIRSIYHTEF
jgi:hypothetical protein